MILWDVPRTVAKDRRCAGDKMCEFIVDKMQSIRTIQLSLFFNKANRYFAITATLRAEIEITENVILQEMVMRIAISFRTPFSFKILGVVVLHDKDATGSTYRFTGLLLFYKNQTVLNFLDFQPENDLILFLFFGVKNTFQVRNL